MGLTQVIVWPALNVSNSLWGLEAEISKILSKKLIIKPQVHFKKLK